jgi:hypothetical protein
VALDRKIADEVLFEPQGNRRYERGDKSPSEYCYLSDADAPSLPSLFGDDFLKFDKG